MLKNWELWSMLGCVLMILCACQFQSDKRAESTVNHTLTTRDSQQESASRSLNQSHTKNGLTSTTRKKTLSEEEYRQLIMQAIEQQQAYIVTMQADDDHYFGQSATSAAYNKATELMLTYPEDRQKIERILSEIVTKNP
ncbi:MULTISPECIES: hypothetical protein [unclassified Granulicatella]|uniref:hypothetical protein n=1 Tax=unclassified Granulicatella TaxID=2630493 RepID=UPI0010730089|nr:MULTISPECIES: hypothetical protein [unclassified Granulicatella]MBF0779491.1 hypothetical protein [Granulicatella sp. 19428wC4_WM01]TFU96457.1 hypothetical protein E4T68_00140 [Granulicatella sp. WM01]